MKLIKILLITLAPTLALSQYHVDSLKQELVKARSPEDSISTILEISNIYNQSKTLNDDSLNHYAHIGIDVAERVKDSINLPILYTYFAVSHYYSDSTMYFSYLRRSEDLAASIGNYPRAMKSALYETFRRENFSDYNLAIKAIRRGLEYAEMIPADSLKLYDKHTICRFYEKNALNHLRLGHVDEALKWTYTLRDYAQAQDLKIGRMEAFATLIDIYNTIAERMDFGVSSSSDLNVDSLLLNAIDSVYALSKTKSKRPEKSRYLESLVHKANYYLRKNELDSAELYLHKAKSYWLEYDHNLLGLRVQAGLYDLCKERNFSQNCYLYLEQMQTILKKTKTERWDVELYSRELDFFRNIKDLSEGDRIYKKLEGILDDYPMESDFIDDYELMSSYAAMRGNAVEALDYYKTAVSIKDSLKLVALTRNIEDLRIQYDVKSTEAENALLKEEQAKIALNNIRNLLTISIMSFLAILILSYFIYRSRTRRLRMEKSRENFKQRMLRSQISPHFTFNVLGTIQGYIYEGKLDKAEESLGMFSKIIRKNLEYTSLEDITIKEEINFLEDYLSLEHGRKDGLFDYHIHVDGHHLLKKKIQPLFIQPIVENSIKHGFRNMEHGGLLELNFKINEDGFAIVTIEDNGRGFDTAKASNHRSLGLSLIRERMEILNRDTKKYSMEIDTSSSGTKTIIKLPYD